MYLVSLTRVRAFGYVLGLLLALGGSTYAAPFTDLDKPEKLTGTTSTAIEDIEVKGTVVDAGSMPIPGVAVTISGTYKGVVTDVDGKYEISVPEGSTLTFSFMGFETKSITVGNQTVIDVTLEESVSSMDEVVVVGYGTQKKVNVTGAISVVDSKTIENRPITNASQALQGAQGVYVNQAGGQPGADDATIRIRGMGSIGGAGKLNPLVLVDGVEFPLRDVNPNDIESISVLKDAASTAIYGSRAANGVILITTKMGNKDSNSFDYSGYAGVQKATYLPDPVENSADFMEGYNRAMINQGSSPIYSQELIDEFRNNPTSLIYPNTNWMDVMFGTAWMQEHNLRFSGGTSRTKYNLSAGYLDQDGVLKGMTGSKKYTANIKVNTQVSDKFNVGGGIFVTRWDVEQPASGIGTVMNRIMRMVPVQPVGKLPNGNWPDSYVITPGQNGFQNPLIWAEEAYRNEREDRIMANLTAGYQFTNDLKYSILTSVNSASFFREDWYPEVMAYDVKTGKPSRPWSPISTKTNYQQNEQRLNFTQMLTYDKMFGEKHAFNVLLGNSVETFETRYFQAGVQGFSTTDLRELDLGTKNPSVAGTSAEDALISYFGRIQYAYEDKYMLEFNSRYDGSSKFSKDSRWGFFPSFSLGWRMSEEAFLKNVTWLDELKLRGSWGQIGNQEIGRFQYINAVELGYGYAFGGGYQGGSAIVQARDPDLRWETTTMTNLGVDWALFQGKLQGELEYFYKRTDGILRQVAIPSQVGALGGPIKNIATVDNWGYEIGLNYNDQINDSWSYSLGGNLTHIKNKVVNLDGEEVISGGKIIREGYPIDSWYVLKTDGFFQTQEEVDNYATITDRVGPGDIKYVDLNNDGKIDGEDRYVAGNTFPELMYAFNFDIKFKGFSLSAIWQGVSNISVRPDFNLASPYNNGAGLTKDWLTDSWTPENPNASLPRITARNQYTAENFSDSDFWLEDASYLRLKNVQLAYDFGGPLLERLGMSQLRVFINGQNLLTISDVTNFDPERDIKATNITQYPTVKTTTMGVNIKF